MNPKTVPFDPTRRKFLGQCCAAVGATGMLSALAQLRLFGAVASPTSSGVVTAAGIPEDFRAVVCIFLLGGNDANNVVIPIDTAGYDAYAAGRASLALPRSSALAIAPRTSDGHSYGLHPAMPELQSLFAQGKFGVLANVGTLVAPTTKQQYAARSVPLPPQLFSHSDQQVQWQSSVPDQSFSTGWGGRLADLTNAFNSNNSVSMSMTLDGQNSFQVGREVIQFAVNPTGAIVLNQSPAGDAVNAVRTKAMNDLMAAENDHLFATAFGGMNTTAISNSLKISSFLTGDAPFTTAFPETRLGQQLRTIARLIAAAPRLNLKRQVFFARMAGFDLHGQQVNAGNTAIGTHADLLRDLSQSLGAFYNATVELGCANQVTAFTASDFGRTFNSNGDGSDHGWGSHHLVVGGGVKGGDIYGRMPEWKIDGPDDTGHGRWIPTTSVDEYSATLARWFGVSDTNLPVVLPNIGRFAQPNLGFMA
jgi:uncharacterized protein (DUF1501 family)